MVGEPLGIWDGFQPAAVDGSGNIQARHKVSMSVLACSMLAIILPFVLSSV